MDTFHTQNQAFVPPPGGLILVHNEDVAAVVSTLARRGTQLTTALNRLTGQAPRLAALAQCLVETLQRGCKVLAVGNGGSAAEAQHFVAELVGRFQHERLPYPALALTTDTAILTAIANDYGYEEIFARQIRAFGQPHDLLLAFSTSGESANVLRAAKVAHEQSMTVAALVSERSCRLARLADLAIQVPSLETSATQELHLVIMHLLCEIVEEHLTAQEKENHA